MEIKGEAKLVRIFIGESDVLHHIPVYERIVQEAKKFQLAGATVFKGIMGFGGRSRIHTSKILRLSEDMPMIIEIVDEEEKIGKFLPILHDIFEEADCGGLITMEKAEIIKYVVHKKKCIKREIVSKEFNLCLTKDIYVNNFDSVKGDLHEIYINRDNTHSIFNSNLFCTTSLANNGPRRMVLPESISSRAKNS